MGLIVGCRKMVKSLDEFYGAFLVGVKKGLKVFVVHLKYERIVFLTTFFWLKKMVSGLGDWSSTK